MVGERAVIQIMSKHMENLRDLCENDCYHRWPMKEFSSPRSGQTLEEAGFTVDPWLGSELQSLQRKGPCSSTTVGVCTVTCIG